MGAFSMAKMANRGAVLPLSVFGDCALATLAEMDFELKTIPDGFYAKHAIYLWLTTGMWFVGLIYPLCGLPLYGIAASRYCHSPSHSESQST
jgi:hypothetical protein